MHVTNSDFKISFCKPQYFFNEEKGTVTCKMDYFLYTPQAREYYCPFHDGIAMEEGPFRTVIASARCMKEDKFDRQTGINVARTKAENKAYEQAQKLINKRCEELVFFLAAVDRFTEKKNKHNSHNEEYIKRITE